jgi:hypothetical protein
MNLGLLLILIALGAGAVALWADVRLTRFTPKDLRQAIVIAQLAVPLLMKTMLAAESPVAVLVAIFGVAFPALTYCLLASIWIIKILQGSLRHR